MSTALGGACAFAAVAIGGWLGLRRRRSARRTAVGLPVGPNDGRITLGRFRIVRELGRGSMGVVYLGHDTRDGRAVAIKTLAPGRERGAEAFAADRVRFFREAEAARRLHHPDIVTVLEAGEAADVAFIAMEFAPGEPLVVHTRPGTLLPVATVVSTVARVALALAHAHEQGIVHRDIKPSNVLLDIATGSVKVTDFGIATLGDAARTRTGEWLGTPRFMSPEQLLGQRVDGRSDLYSLGVTLFQLLTGDLPYRTDSMGTLLRQIAQAPAPDVRTLRAALPAVLAEVVALALQKQPQARYASGRQMAADLDRAGQQWAREQPGASSDNFGATGGS